MKRKIAEALLQWKKAKNRMPLIVNGARQIGKTYSILEFGMSEYQNVIHINLEKNKLAANIFEDNLTPSVLVQKLEFFTENRILPGTTLLFFDEIQACDRALTSLKYFCEDAPEYHVVAAGSLLGVAVNREKYSFPVGKVDELYMYPLDFEEFLWAIGIENFVGEIRTHFEQNLTLEKPLHKLGLDLFYKYCVVGGMPAVVNNFLKYNSFFTIQDEQSKIMNEYIADMSKYATPATSVKIRACYDSIPTQLSKENRKFQYKIAMKGGTSSIFGESIDWLLSAGIVLKCHKIDQGVMPLKGQIDFSNFKLYMSDTGMLTMHSAFPYQMIINSIEVDNGFLGGLAENFVAQDFANKRIPLYYWKSGECAEVDFVVQSGADIIPIEVKKGRHNRAISLSNFVKRFNCPYSIKISQKNFGFENNIRSVPFYALFCLKFN
ncbi:MAG: ATP-binding protein [Bacteroidales bacterium]|jgi:predicted AAA+ superfamily ATPase|nr:ATP-binding protein [Bacteroidales bacterium]